jgi:CDP-diacylglycerol--serine O-phosphatidyltransferase
MHSRRRRFSLQKALFILPNLFTLAAAFCGLYSMVLAAGATRPWDFWAAGWMLGFAGILDGVDGRVARLTRTQSAFGPQLDSLSDCLAFGVAPAWLVYHWGLAELGNVGLAACFAFTAAAMIRLARFNVLADSEDDDPRFFIGLPSPSAAGVPTLIVIVDSIYRPNAHRIGEGAALVMVGVMLVVGVLMVSNLRFRSFKKMRMTKRNLAIFALLVGAVTWISVTTHLEVGLLSGFLAYVLLHVAAAAAVLPRRVSHRLRDHSADYVSILDEEEDDEEAETQLLG